jgi:SAM-dependent methyltransferase
MKDPRFVVFDWFSNQATVAARADFVAQIDPYLAPLIQPGDRVLDLCCGAGPVAFYLEEQGAQVTGIELASVPLGLAREEARRRRSKVDFVQADALTHDLGKSVYDLVVCLGNAISDFPHQSFPRFRDRMADALTPQGRLVLEYRDGLLRVAQMSEPREVVEQGADDQILRRFIKYDPALGAYLSEYRNLTTGETYECTAYVYTGPLIRIALESRFRFEHSVQLAAARFLDIYARR